MTEERIQLAMAAIGPAPFRYTRIREVAIAVLGSKDATGCLYAALRAKGLVETIGREGGFNVYALKGQGQ